MAEIPDHSYEALIQANVEHAKAASAIAEVLRQQSDRQTTLEREVRDQTPILLRISETLKRIEEDQRNGRKEAVEQVKQNHQTVADAQDKKLTRLLWIIAGIYLLAQLAGVSLQKALSLIPR